MVVYSCNTILHSNTNQWTIALLNIKDNSHKYNFEQKKLDTKEYMVYDSIYIKFKIYNIKE